MDRATARGLMAQLQRDARRIAEHFELRYRSLRAERPGVNAHYGICYSDGSIRIRLRHATTGRPLKYSSLVNTLCHELAHLRYFDHGPRFKAFYFEILDWARAEGIYRPGRIRVRPRAPEPQGSRAPRRSTPEQLGLFG